MKKIGKTSKNRIKYLHFCKETCNINSRLFVKIERRDYMNIQEYELMNILADERYKNQRELSEKTGYSLGKINSALKTLVETGYLDGQMGLTKKSRE